MSVQPGPTFKRYAANGVATVYAIPFLLIEASDLQITLDGVLVVSGFALTGVGNPTSTCTFTLPPTGDLLFQLVIPFERLNDYQENGDFLARTVNNDFDRIWQALKELRRDDTRALVVDPLEPEGIPPLPVKALRAARVLAFTPGGDPVPSNLTLAQLEAQPALALESAAAAAASAAEAAGFSDTASAAALAADNSKNAAASSAVLAQKWANEAEDVPVSGGLFSAFHWAQKAAASLASLTARVLALENIGKPFTKEYVSSQQTLTNGGLLTLPHGLAVRPKVTFVELVCVIAEHGWSVGDVVACPDNDTANKNPVVYYDTTNAYVRFGSVSAAVVCIKSSGASQAVTNANWRLVVRAWA